MEKKLLFNLIYIFFNVEIILYKGNHINNEYDKKKR